MKDNNREDLMMAVVELTFACVDLNLYLDNHPEDKNGVAIYNKLCSQLTQAKYNYEAKYGPLSNFGFAPSKYPFQWTESPWPWEL